MSMTGAAIRARPSGSRPVARVRERARPLALEERAGAGRQAVPGLVAGHVAEEGLGGGRAAAGIERPLRVAGDAAEPGDARASATTPYGGSYATTAPMRPGRRAAASSPITPPKVMPTTLAVGIPRASR